jgi:DnaJ family protein C protein 28
MERKSRGIDEIIAQAMREGAFDNLPGKGKPLDLADDANVDPEWKMAYHLLKQNGFVPEFIEQRQLIETELGKARQALQRTFSWRATEIERGGDAQLAEKEWEKAKTLFVSKVEELNKSIASYNLTIPTPSLFRNRIDLQAELKPFTL